MSQGDRLTYQPKQVSECMITLFTPHNEYDRPSAIIYLAQSIVIEVVDNNVSTQQMSTFSRFNSLSTTSSKISQVPPRPLLKSQVDRSGAQDVPSEVRFSISFSCSFHHHSDHFLMVAHCKNPYTRINQTHNPLACYNIHKDGPIA